MHVVIVYTYCNLC